MNQGVRAIVLAAGKGTRMRSTTPKVLHRAAGRALIDYVLDRCAEVGAETVVVTGHEAESVEAACSARPGIRFARQSPQLGTGHATQVALSAAPPDEAAAILVLAGDAPLIRSETLGALLDRHRRTSAAVTLLSFRTPNPGGYGRIVRQDSGAVIGIVEARDASPEELLIDEVNASIYVFDPGALTDALGRISRSNAQGELYLTDAVGLIAKAGKRAEALVVGDPSEAAGVNTLVELAQVERRLFERRAEELLAAGVHIERPDSVLIGPDVIVEPGARLRAFTILEGRTRVAEGAAIGPCCRIVDSEIGPGATVLDSCLILNSRVGAGAAIGPFAHLRPDSVVLEKAKVGNFVELKKTTLGPGSKAPHLSYLGDATIGAGANIGAGTITCNYDGVTKSPTTIEDGAFVGSNSILVAPVTVGRGAYVAAGSVITKPVPEGALAVGRARQENKPGWATRRATRKH